MYMYNYVYFSIEGVTEKEMHPSSYQHHWVESLFPPTFGYTLDEILEDTDSSDKLKDKDTHHDAFAQLANNISPLDLSAIKNVYQRVWLMNKLEKEEKERREKQDFDGDGKTKIT